MSEDLRYPIGEFDRNYETSPDARRARITTITDLRAQVAAAFVGLNESQLDT